MNQSFKGENMSNSMDQIQGIKKNKKVVLLILDGWGLSPSWSGNAISFSNPENFNNLWRTYPHVVLQAFKGMVDPKSNVGNSEIGHASIGCGRIIRQDLTEINEAIEHGYFMKNPVFLEVCDHVTRYKSRLHLVGLLSDGGVHSHINHLYELLKLAAKKNVKDVYIHIITDGVDAPDRSAVVFVKNLQQEISRIGIGKIATCIGRYYAMDKSAHTDRIEKTYLLQTKAKGKKYDDIFEALKENYRNNIFDQMMEPIVIDNHGTIDDFDGVIFYNFRPDRARELSMAYTDKNYFKSIFGRKYRMLKDLDFVTLTSYILPKDSNAKIAFPTSVITDSLSALLSRAGIRQLKIAESEKSAHVTYFFNGGISEPYAYENNLIIDSPNVASYDEVPAMSTLKIRDAIVKALKSNKFQFIVANIANVDMVAHTGNIVATGDAIKITDKAIGEIVNANKDGITIITADHGNAEDMIPYKTSSTRETTHTTNPVPFILVDLSNKSDLVSKAFVSTHVPMYDVLTSKNNLGDIAPTILELFGIAKSSGMTGKSLLEKIGYKK